MGDVTRFPIEKRDADLSTRVDPGGECKVVRLPLDDETRLRLLKLACDGVLPDHELCPY
jgi:anti-sigma factor ChrR (cupin superfamily)